MKMTIPTSRHAGEGGRREQVPPVFELGEQGVLKVPFLNAMICCPIVNMIQRRSYKLETSNIRLEKAIIYMTVRSIAHDITKRVPWMPSISGIHLLA